MFIGRATTPEAKRANNAGDIDASSLQTNENID
jgi:hypothetical protein